MIVQSNDSRLLLITQPDHAALAARVMEAWRADGLLQNNRRELILHAIERHDNGWQEVDDRPLLDADGCVLDFISAPAEVKRGVWPRGVDRLSAMPYTAALVAQHGLHIYRRHRQDSSWADFFTKMTELRDRYADQSSVPLEALVHDYFFVRIGDLVSLTFCNGWTEAQTDDSGSGYRMQLRGNVLTISPDPLAGREIRLDISARELPNRTFRSTREAERAFSEAPRVTVAGVAVGA